MIVSFIAENIMLNKVRKQIFGEKSFEKGKTRPIGWFYSFGL